MAVTIWDCGNVWICFQEHVTLSQMTIETQVSALASKDHALFLVVTKWATELQPKFRWPKRKPPNREEGRGSSSSAKISSGNEGQSGSISDQQKFKPVTMQEDLYRFFLPLEFVITTIASELYGPQTLRNACPLKRVREVTKKFAPIQTCPEISCSCF